MKNLPYRLSLGIRVIRRLAYRSNAAARRTNRKLCNLAKPLHVAAERLDWALLGTLAVLFVANLTGGYSTNLHDFEGAHIQLSASVVWLGIWVQRQSDRVIS